MRSLSEAVQEMFTDFNDMVTQLSGKSYDPLDPLNKVGTVAHTSAVGAT